MLLSNVEINLDIILPLINGFKDSIREALLDLLVILACFFALVYHDLIQNELSENTLLECVLLELKVKIVDGLGAWFIIVIMKRLEVWVSKSFIS